MSDTTNKLFATSIEGQDQASEILKKLIAVAQPTSVYSEPIQAEKHTIITATEVSVSMGFGYGAGGGSETSTGESDTETEEVATSKGSGGGGGGGGYSTGRPVAAIIINADEVRIEPIVDRTKIAIAFFTALGSMLLLFNKIRRRRK
ncbi:MAG: spore germination protein GerW family protein [Chloroflexota bacterium]